VLCKAEWGANDTLGRGVMLAGSRGQDALLLDVMKKMD